MIFTKQNDQRQPQTLPDHVDSHAVPLSQIHLKNQPGQSQGCDQGFDTRDGHEYQQPIPVAYMGGDEQGQNGRRDAQNGHQCHTSPHDTARRRPFAGRFPHQDRFHSKGRQPSEQAQVGENRAELSQFFASEVACQ